MKILFLNDCDVVNYKKLSMFIGFPYCTFKCNKDAGENVCQNYKLIDEEKIDISYDEIVKLYLDNPLTSAIVFGGLEPFCSYNEMLELIKAFREHTDDDIVIYTGYTKEEVADKIPILSQFSNIIIKFGRFKPGQKQHFDEILGVKLYGNDQFAEKIS